MLKLKNLSACKQDLTLCQVQSRRFEFHSLCFYAMMYDLRQIIVRAIQRGERQADIFRQFKNDGVSQVYFLDY